MSSTQVGSNGDPWTPEPLRRLLRQARLRPARLLDLLHGEVAIRDRLATAGSPDLMARLPGLGAVNLTLRDGQIEGAVSLGPELSLQFGGTDALIHRGMLPASTLQGIEGEPLSTIADPACLRGAAHRILGVRTFESPPTTILMFKAARVGLVSGRKA